MSKATKLRAVSKGEKSPKEKHRPSRYARKKGYIIDPKGIK